jgi:hypothetical protein
MWPRQPPLPNQLNFYESQYIEIGQTSHPLGTERVVEFTNQVAYELNLCVPKKQIHGQINIP